MTTQERRIVIAQTYRNILDLLEENLRAAKDLEVHYVTTPTEAFKLAADPKTSILVTGQCFYGSDSKRTGDMSTLFRMIHPQLGPEMIEDALRRFGDLQDGNGLAGAVREANSNIITLRYSMTPESTQYFCGDVSKISGNLTGLLMDKEFNRAITDKDLSLLPQRPGVSWYTDTFPKDWKRTA